jgi:predicted MPP superfamily phosphohydrolase
MSELTWLHISDLHLRDSEQHRWDEDIVLKALLRDVADCIQHEGLHPDFIVVTGDIAFSGRKAEYDSASQFFDSLLETTGLGKDRLFLVPGNHDVDRRRLDIAARAMATAVKDRESANQALAQERSLRILFDRFYGYATFVNTYLDDCLPFDHNSYYYVRTLDLSGQRIAVLGLNSAWLAGSDEDRHHLALGERQVRAALEQARGANLSLALMHHPFDWLRDFDRGDAEPLLCDACDFVLHGHMHEPGLLQASTPDSNAMIVTAGACYKARDYPNTYNLVRLDLAQRAGAVYLRRYSDERGGFWTKDTQTYRNAPDGCYEFHLQAEPAAGAPAPRLPARVPFQVPVVPRYFVTRPEFSREIQDALQAESPPGALGITVVQGLGGCGKTTLVAGLIHDLRDAFPGGVLWVTLGQQPDLLSLLIGWIQALGDRDFHPTVVESASRHLRTWLDETSCLLVVDDAWQADHVRPFLVGGERCRLLVTTRDASLARKLPGATLVELDVMTEAQALELFERRLGPLDGARPQAMALADELGYLPLALELAAAQVEAGFSWSELLEAFSQPMADLRALDLDEAAHRQESLRICFRLSLDRLSPQDQEAFTWLGVYPDDVRLNPAMAVTLWPSTEPEARRRLRRLRDKALLKTIGPDLYTIHDLLYDEARLRLGEQMPLGEAHAALLARYQAGTRDGLWHTLTDDGYIHAHLAWHFESAGQLDAVHDLLCEQTTEGANGWYQACERLGQTASYLADVARAWRLAELPLPLPVAVREERAQLRGAGPGLQCRYALIAASLKSLAGNIPVSLPAQLVAVEIWTKPQGLAYAQQIPDPQRRVEALLELRPHLPARMQEETLATALAAARGIRAAENRLDMLLKLADVLPPKPRAEALQDALSAARDIRPKAGRALGLARLAQRLAPEQAGAALRDAKRAAQAIPWPQEQVRVLVEMFHLLPAALTEEALVESLATAWAVPWYEGQMESLSLLAPLLSGLPAELLWPRVAQARVVGGEWLLAETLDLLLPHCSTAQTQALLWEALQSAQALEDAWPRTVALLVLLAHLPAAWLEGAQQDMQTAIRAVDWQEPEAAALAGLVSQLVAVGCFAKAEQAARCIELEAGPDQVEMVSSLALQLADSGRPEEARMAARAIARQPEQSITFLWLFSLLPQLRDEAHAQLLTLQQVLEDAGTGRAAWLDLAWHLAEAGHPEHATDVVWIAYHGMPSPGDLSQLAVRLNALELTGKAQALLDTLLGEYLEWVQRELQAAAHDLQDLEGPQAILARLALRLVDLGHLELAWEALSIAQTGDFFFSDDLGYLPDDLGYLAFRLVDLDLPSEALDAVRALPEPWMRVEVLVHLIPDLPPAVRAEAEAELQAASEATGLPSDLPEDQVDELQEDLGEADLDSGLPWPEPIAGFPSGMYWDSPRPATSGASSRLLAHLPAGLAAAAERATLAEAEQAGDQWESAAPLSRLLDHLPPAEAAEALRKTLDEAQEEGDEHVQAEVILELLPHLPPEWQDGARQAAQAALQVIEGSGGQAAILAQLASRLLALDQPSMALETIWALRDDWGQSSLLHTLACHLVESGLAQEALTAASAIPEQTVRAAALADLTRRLPEEYQESTLREALALTKAIRDDDDRILALVCLAAHLPPERQAVVVPQLYASVRAMDYPAARSEAFVDLLSHLPPELAQSATGERSAEGLPETEAALMVRSGSPGEAYETVQATPEPFAQAMDHLELASQLPAAGRTVAVQLAFVALQKWTSGSWAATLADLVADPGRPRDLQEIDQALQAAQQVLWQAEDQARLLAALAPYLPEELRDRALDRALRRAMAASDRLSRVRAWSFLQPHLRDEVRASTFTQLQESTQAIELPWARAEALAILLPFLHPEEERVRACREVLDTLRDAEQDSDQAHLLAALASYLPEAFYKEALTTARAIESPASRSWALSALLPLLLQQPAATLRDLWQNNLHHLATRARPDFLSDLRALCPTLVALGGQEAVAETYAAVEDVGRWWS